MTKLSVLFAIKQGHSLELNRLKRALPGQSVAFVSRQMGNNGISAWVEELDSEPPAPPGELTCALSGNGVMTTHLQEQRFYTGFHVARLSPLTPMTKAQLLFYAMCIKANRYRYSYGRQANRSIRDLEVPDLSSLPTYLETAEVDKFSGRNAALAPGPTPPIALEHWKPFRLDALFIVKKGKRLTKGDMSEGSVPFVGAIDKQNGIRQLISAKARHPAGVLTVNYNGSVAETFYQPEAFFASDDVNVLYPRLTMSPAALLFICTIIKQEKYRFNYGRKWKLERMNESIIYLPATSEVKPNLVYMDHYISTLPFSSSVPQLVDA